MSVRAMTLLAIPLCTADAASAATKRQKRQSIEALHALRPRFRAPARLSTRTARQPPAAAASATIETSTTGDAAEIRSAAE